MAFSIERFRGGIAFSMKCCNTVEKFPDEDLSVQNLGLPTGIIKPAEEVSSGTPTKRTAATFAPRNLSYMDGLKDAHRTTQETIDRYIVGQGKGRISASVASPLFQSLLTPEQNKPITLSHEVSHRQGKRPTMEDRHFYRKMPHGVLAGVLDGHAGRKVADRVAELFPGIFASFLKAMAGRVHAAFEASSEFMQAQIIKEEKLLSEEGYYIGGCTAVVCYIETLTSIVHTMSIGDSEAHIYRKNDHTQYRAIPLCPALHWGSKREAKRAVKCLENWSQQPGISMNPQWIPYTKLWTDREQCPDPKSLRFPSIFFLNQNKPLGANFSRSFGDLAYTGTKDIPGVFHKPEITVNILRPGDKLALYCDGLTENAPQAQIEERISKFKRCMGIFGKTLSQDLVDFAIDVTRSTDNVSVLIVHVGAGKKQVRSHREKFEQGESGSHGESKEVKIEAK